MQSTSALPLAGLKVIELAGGAAAAYCGRLLVDAGASVTLVTTRDGTPAAGLVRDAGLAAEAAYADYLHAGKQLAAREMGADALAQLCAQADILLVGEDSPVDATTLSPRLASIDLCWFGQAGPYRNWKANDLIIQSLTGLPQLAGEIDGPPIHSGDRHSTIVAGVTAYIAALAGVLAGQPADTRRFQVSILEANIVLSEMHMHFFERDGIALGRHGINRFHPNSPVGVYPCREGWIGITATTPEQWKSLCVVLGLQKEGADEALATRELRFARIDEVETAMVAALAARTALEWAALGRQHKVPMVIVPDAAGILSHPIFADRGALAVFQRDGRDLKVPRTPFGLTRTPVASVMSQAAPAARSPGAGAAAGGAAGAAGVAGTSLSPAGTPDDDGPLAGIKVVDFTMGWAGPLASRLVADLGATVLKIEAGRYPDWWRGVNWTAEYIATRAFENAKPFLALNRGKWGVSVDLTTSAGRQAALSLVAGADAVVENQAAGVMAKMGLSYEQLAAVNPRLVMVSMSAFGTGNAWSDTRAYGSTLEQGAGLPSFMGFADARPTMYHLAYGDPIGGLYGCAAMLTALIERRRSGKGQYVNLSQVEAILQFTTPALLTHQLGDGPVPRRGNRHVALVPHGIYRAAGSDEWLALSVDSGAAFAALARLIGRPEWAGDPQLQTLEGRRAREDAIDAAISAWSQRQDPDAAASLLQTAGIAAAPLLHAETLFDNPQFAATDFYIDLEREFSGPQRQVGLSIRLNGRRLGARRAAPLMGEHSWQVLSTHGGLSRDQYEAWVAEGIVTFGPTAVRNTTIS